MEVVSLCSNLLCLSLALVAPDQPVAQSAPGTEERQSSQESLTLPVHFEFLVEREQTQSALQTGDSIYVGETLWLELHIDLEQKFFEEQLLSQWRAPLDFQAELTTPWAGASPSFLLFPSGVQGQTSLVVDREEGFLQRLEPSNDGRVHFQLRRKVQIQDVSFALPRAQLKLSWATEFEEDMIRGRIPLDRKTQVFTTAALSLDVLPVPNENQPLDFYGAVGDYSMELTEYESQSENEGLRRFQVAFRGVGTLTSEQLPRFGQLVEFPLSGQRLETTDWGITVHLETHSEQPFPFVSWSFFQPSRDIYVTRSIGLEPPAIDPQGIPGGKWTPWIWLAGFVTLLLGVFFWPKANSNTPATAGEKRRVPQTVKREPQDLVDDLALLFRCTREEVYADHSAARLSQSGIDAALAEACSAAMQTIYQARYANRGNLPSDADLIALRKRLQASS